jgi:hypothetical protein
MMWGLPWLKLGGGKTETVLEFYFVVTWILWMCLIIIYGRLRALIYYVKVYQM